MKNIKKQSSNKIAYKSINSELKKKLEKYSFPFSYMTNMQSNESDSIKEYEDDPNIRRTATNKFQKIPIQVL